MADGNTRAALRATLLENGFEPLPLDGKACYIPGWSHVDIDAAFLERFRRSGKYSNTGIRCGNVVAIDIDCDDQDLCDVMAVVVEDALGRTEWWRIGRAPRVLLLYWTDTPIPKLRTGRYGGQQVEVLGKGCQFAAYGIHPTTGLAYEWGACSPECCSVDELPAVTAAQLRDLVPALEAVLLATGRALESPGADLGETPQHDYCLTDAMVFDCLDRGIKTVAELRDELPASGGWECNLTAIRPDSDSRAGRAHRAHDGSVCVSDFVTGVTYFEAVDDVPDDAAGMAALQSAIVATTASAAIGGVFGAPPANALADLLQNYCYVVSDGTVRRFDDPSRGARLAQFSQGRRQWIVTGTSRQLLVNHWLENGAVVCERADFAPYSRERVITVDGVRVLNTYVAPTFPLEGGTTGIWREFIDGLIPDAGERALLLDWIATKVQSPWIRMHGLVVASAEFGTGRGTLVDILGRLLGSGYCRALRMEHLFGSTYQSQYTDWLDGSLLATIAEAQDTSNADAPDWRGRRRAYEAIKEAIETQAGEQFIIRKRVASGNAMVYTSIFIATNNADALAIDAGDRRLIVLTGGAAREARFYERLRAWMGVRENVGALWRELSGRDTSSYNPYGPVAMTKGKARMIAAATSDLDRAWMMFQSEAPGDLFTAQQWKAFLLHCKADRGMNLPADFASKGVAEALLNRKAQRLNEDNPRWQLNLDRTTRVRPWVLRNASKWASAEVRTTSAELLKNGDPTQRVSKISGAPWD